jgi:hypothetical protein
MVSVGAIGKPKREIFIPVPPMVEPAPDPARAPDPEPAPSPDPGRRRPEPVPAGT